MGDAVARAVDKANRGLMSEDHSQADEVIAGEDQINAMDLNIGRKSAELLCSLAFLSAAEQWKVTAALKAVTDLERIADLAESCARIARERSAALPDVVTQRLRRLADLALEMVAAGLRALAGGDLREIHRLREHEDTVEAAYRWLHAELLRHLEKEPKNLNEGVRLLFAAHNLKRIAAHATDIGEWAIYAKTGELGKLKGYSPTAFPMSLLPLI